MREQLRRTVLHPLIVLLSAPFFGCSNEYPEEYFQLLRREQQFDLGTFVEANVDFSDKLDLHFIIDDSGSMSGDQADLRANLFQFAPILPLLKFCYTVSTTSAYAIASHAQSQGRQFCYDPNNPGGFSANDVIERFKDDVIVGSTNSSPYNTELIGNSMATWLLETHGFSAPNRTLNPVSDGVDTMRQDAVSVLIPITDEDYQVQAATIDGVNLPADAFCGDDAYNMFKGAREAVDPTGDNLILIRAVYQYSTMNSGSAACPGNGMHAMRDAAVADGNIYNESDIGEDWSNIVSGLIEDIEGVLNLFSEFAVGFEVEPESVVVFIVSETGEVLAEIPEHLVTVNGNIVNVSTAHLLSWVEANPSLANGAQIVISFVPVTLLPF